MEQIYFGQRIAELRRAKGMTQGALAQKLGITNQAVSKWESDQCCPDIMQLPALADVFEISLDALFGREMNVPAGATVCDSPVIGELPWEDNNDLHAVCYVGHRLMRYQDIGFSGGGWAKVIFSGFGGKSCSDPVILEFSGTVDNIYSDFSVTCRETEIRGNVQAGDGVICAGVEGDVNAGDSVSCSGNVSGNVQAGDSITCRDVGGSVDAGDSVSCSGSILGDVTAGGDIRCGDIRGMTVANGDIFCNS